MSKSSLYALLALAAGILLALMIKINSSLASGSSAVFASWAAHGIGAITALILIFIVINFSKTKKTVSKTTHKEKNKPPFWAYLGGLPGAFTVVLASITVNSEVGLSGTLALGLIGQIVFSLVCDHFGLLGMKKKTIVPRDLLMVSVIVLGSFLLIFSKA